ncbi:PiggyBac transposable element-derived protein 4 [Cucumispora dikerogammari]|nr:PiggyBac transposable element-derived protein 4 [Cucumispora dikerogammari]
MIHSYNQHMGGVDKYDQMLQLYFTARKNKKWTNKLAIYFINLMVHNTYVLYKTFSKEENKINTHLDFRTACIRYLLEKPAEKTISNIQRKKTKDRKQPSTLQF